MELTHFEEIRKDTNSEIASAPNAEIQTMLIKLRDEIRYHKKVMVSISGGSDSDIMMDAVYRMDPDRKAVYVFFNTGLEYDATKRHLEDLEKKYGVKIEWVDPVLPIPSCVKKYGVPFWSKLVSQNIAQLQRHGFHWEDGPLEELIQTYPKCKTGLRWWCNENRPLPDGTLGSYNIGYTPWLKEFMMAYPPTMPISDKCCDKAKKDPARGYEEGRDFDLKCIGVRKAEGGVRATAYKTCFDQHLFGPDEFRPLFWFSDRDKQVYKDHYRIVNSDCYEVWGMKRTGCCGCPFNKNFESDLLAIKRYEPKLYRAAVSIFGDSYEYTRAYLRFRAEKEREQKIKKEMESGQTSLFEEGAE